MPMVLRMVIAAALLPALLGAGPEAPDPEAWAKAALAGPADGAAYPETLALLGEKNGAPAALAVDAEAVEAATYLELRAPESLGLLFALNRELPLAKGAAAGDKLRDAADADLVVVAAGGKLRLLRRAGKGVLAQVQEAAGEPDAASINKFLFDALRYNAVAIEQKGDYLLVHTPVLAKGRAAQGLVLAGSRAAWTLRGQPPGGDGLLQLARAGERFAAFKILVAPEAKVERGTKILLEGAP